MPGVENFLHNPLEIVDRIYETNSQDVEWDKKLDDYFMEKLKSSLHMIEDINSKSLEAFKEYQIVRFKCMVQDMLDPEIYFDCFKVKDKKTGEVTLKTSRLRENISSNTFEEIILDTPSCSTKDRHVLKCIPIPGSNPWVYECLVSNSYEDENPGKRKCDVLDPTKRLRSEDSQAVTINTGVAPFSCLVKLYKDFDVLLLNDMVDFIGILNLDCDQLQDVEMNGIENIDPVSKGLPSIHVLMWQKLSHCNPFLPSIPSELESLINIDEISCIRESLLSLLNQAFGGDILVAEYILSHLVSSVYMRKDTLAIGKFSLNLFNVPITDWIGDLYSFVASVTERSLLLPLTLEQLNKTQFIPCKNYEKDELTCGLLQLASNTHLLVDETKLNPGTLDANGVKNLTALGHMISWQKVSYDFKFHQMEYDSNVPVFIVSEGKSLLPNDFSLPLRNSSSLDCTTLKSLPINKLALIRKYLTLVKSLNYSVEDNMTLTIEEDFVKMRQEDQSISADDLHRLLILARLLTISCGNNKLTLGIWRKAKSLEAQRKQILNNFVRNQ